MDDERVHNHSTMYSTLTHTLPSIQQNLLAHLDRLKFFLATAPSRWSSPDTTPASHQHPALNRFLLPSGEYVTCVMWSGLYHITGTDIVRALVFRFEAFGRPVRNMKKFEEGVFSDLRNLKPGHDACLEEPKSPFLDLLFKYQCIRTQKKQKVFYWFSVPHDRLFLDALERDLKREKMGHEPTTSITGEPAASFTHDPKRSLYEQFAAKPAHVASDNSLARAVYPVQPESISSCENTNISTPSLPELDYGSVCSSLDSTNVPAEPPTPPPSRNPLARTPFFNMFSLFEGSPTYKQRRKKAPKARRSLDREQAQTQMQPTHFLAGPGQFSFASTGISFPSSAHLGRHAVHLQQHNPERAPEREHVQVHDREEPEPEMEVDAGGSPASQFVTEGPVTPQYSFEEEQLYSSNAAPAEWTPGAAIPENSTYGTQNALLPSSGYSMRGYSYDSPANTCSPPTEGARSVTSHSLPTISVSTSHIYYDAQHQHPLSAPSHRVTFDAYPTAESPARRPRSVTPSLPAARAPHVRRPSTANEAQTTHEVVPSLRTQVSRGYHPYAQRPASTYSSSGSSATSSMLAVQQEYEYDASPFAYMVNGAAEAYPTEQGFETAVYASSPGSPAAEQQRSPQYNYGATYMSSHAETDDGVGYQTTASQANY